MMIKEKVSIEYLTKELERLEQTLNSKKSKMEIVIAGDVKAGKSTLINAIFNDDGLCETGVVRTTVSNKIVEAEHYRIMDTPGINANNEDTKVAGQGYEKADFFLFTHNIIDGELLAKEIEFLQQVKAFFKDEAQFVRNTFVILTNAHQLEEAHLALAIEKVKQQIQLVTKLEMQLFVVDSVSYLTALQEDKMLLIEDSGIPILQDALEVKAKEFNANAVNERKEMLSVKKDALLVEIISLENGLKQELKATQEQTLDSPIANNLLKEVKEFESKVVRMLDYDAFISENGGHAYGVIDVSHSSLSPSNTYKSESSAISAGVNVLREKVIPKAEREYIKNRKDLIDHYRNMLPNYNGNESVISQLQGQVETQLMELKMKLMPLATIFKLDEIANSNVVLNIPKQDVSDEEALRHSSSIYAEGFEHDYNIESASWYDSDIDTLERIEYKKGLFGEKMIETYSFMAYSAKIEIQNHLNDSIKNAHDSIKYAFNRIFNRYANNIKQEVKEIISTWATLIERELKKGNAFHKQLQVKIEKLEQEIRQLQQLEDKLQNL